MEESNAKRQVEEMRNNLFAQEIEAGKEGKEVFAEIENVDPNIQVDSREYGAHRTNNDWRCGLLAARSVKLDTGSGIRTDLGNDLPRLENGNKVSARAFARLSGVSHPTVTKDLTIWNLAAADGHVPDSHSLIPGQEYKIDSDVLTPELWKSYKPKGDVNEKNAFISLNDHVTTFSSKLEDKWSDAKTEYEDQRDVSLETFRENVKSAKDALSRLLVDVDKEAKAKKYIDLNQE